jgi:hypothetical protein
MQRHFALMHSTIKQDQSIQSRLELQHPRYFNSHRFRKLISSFDPCKGKGTLVHVHTTMAGKEV